MFKLLIEDEEGGKKVFPLVHDEITIGRDKGNTIHLAERNISRHHGRLIREDGRLFVEAVSARYGLRKNGKRLSQREEFAEGDVLLIGDYRVMLQAEAKAAPPVDLKPPPGAVRSSFSDEVTQITSITEGSDLAAAREHTQIMATVPAKLVVISSNFAGQEFPLNRDEIVIGRGDDCHVIIDHRSISTKHAKIVREPNAVYKIVDLNSKNGVKVSGEEYRATHLKRGDIVELGHVKFRFVEPGENYVFTPQPAGFDDDFSATSASQASKKGLLMLIGVAFVGVVVLSGLIVMMMSNDSAEPANSVATVVSGDSEVKDRAQDAIDKAGVDIADGQLQRAMGALELVRSNLDPSPEQVVQIGEMLSKARNEQPFQRAYMQAKELAENKKYGEALGKIQSIPSHSLFQELLEKQGLTQTVINGAITDARDNYELGEIQASRDIVAEILAYDSEHVEARKLLALLDKSSGRSGEALAVVQPVANPVDTKNLASTKTPTKASSSKPKSASRPAPKAKAPKVSPEEAKALFASAFKKMSAGDPRGAIADCQQGLSGGHINCHRILGVAYSQINDTNKACRHFSQFLRSQPSDRPNIVAQMEKLGCPP